MGKPAAAVGDTHVCPSLDPKPHVGGPILPPGCPTVLIGGRPAARVTDMATCVGVPDAIVMGSLTCLVGGQPPARMGDLTAHGGTIAIGNPTVLIGDVPASFPFKVSQSNGELKVGDNTTIQGDADYQVKVLRDLIIISKTKTGLTRLKSLNSSKKPVRIKPAETGKGNKATADNGPDAVAAGKPAWDDKKGTGKGTGTTVSFNPDREPATAADPSLKRPADVGLNHELAHAEAYAKGTVDRSPDPANPKNPHIHETQVIEQDNLYRQERRIPTRANHHVL